MKITTLLIPGENDSEKELEEMTQWVVTNLGPEIPMHFTAFHPDWKMMNKLSTPMETLIKPEKLLSKMAYVMPMLATYIINQRIALTAIIAMSYS